MCHLTLTLLQNPGPHIGQSLIENYLSKPTIDILQIWQHFYSNFERCINCSFLKNIIFAQCEFVPSSFKDPTPSSV